MIQSALLALALTVTLHLPAAAVQPDPCAGEALEEDEIGLVYRGHCVPVDRDGPTVQTVIVERTETLEGFHARCIVVIRTDVSVWKIAPDLCYVPDAEDVDLGDDALVGAS